MASDCVPTGTRHENKQMTPAIIHMFSIFFLPIQIIFVILHRQTLRSPQGQRLCDRTYNKDVVTAFYLRRIELRNFVFGTAITQCSRPWWVYSTCYIRYAWASALLILFQRQCEGQIRGISKVADSRASFLYTLQTIHLTKWRSGNHRHKGVEPDTD